jgi:hypothetical protein
MRTTGWTGATLMAVVGTTWLMASGVAQAQAQSEAVSPPAVAGTVIAIDNAGGRVTVRGDDGTVYEFQASSETLEDLEVGDRIEATRRSTAQ